MRTNNQRRLEAIIAASTSEEDWQISAVRRMLPVLRDDADYANLARRPLLAGTSPEVAAGYQAAADAYLIQLCQRHGEHRLAEYWQSSHDTN